MSSEAPPSYCYRQAHLKKKNGDISEREYFYQIFQHASRTGKEHKGDDGVHSDLEKLDPLGYSLNCMIHNVAQPLDDSTLLENVFSAYRSGKIEDIDTTIKKLPAPYQNGIRKPLALFALQERNALVLKWLIDDGVVLNEETFELEARRVQKGKKDIETWKLLHESKETKNGAWRQARTAFGDHPLR